MRISDWSSDVCSSDLAGRRSEGGLQPIAGGRVADARAGIDIIVAEALAYQLLNQKSLFVRAAAGGDAADRARAVFRLDAAELAGGVGDRFQIGRAHV